jgi:hypothetical protein
MFERNKKYLTQINSNKNFVKLNKTAGHAIAQAVSRRLPTAAA